MARDPNGREPRLRKAARSVLVSQRSFIEPDNCLTNTAIVVRNKFLVRKRRGEYRRHILIYKPYKLKMAPTNAAATKKRKPDRSSLAPIQIVTQEYPQNAGYNLPTDALPRDPGRFIIEESLTPGAYAPYLQSTLQANDHVIPLPHEPRNTCYRNAGLAALFNLQPFVNFVHQATLSTDDIGTTLPNLHGMIQAFRNNITGGTSQQSQLKDATKTFWKVFQKPWDEHCKNSNGEEFDAPRPAKGRVKKSNSMEDSVDFLSFLFESVEDDDLGNDKNYPSDQAQM